LIKITFIYKGSTKPPDIYCKLAEKVTNLVNTLYILPQIIEVQFEEMGPSIYGMTMLDPRFPNRIRINQDLSLEEFLLPLTHELVHLHQIYTNKLQARSGGKILWEGQIYKSDSSKLSYDEYLNLPWEFDANQKQKQILEFLKQHKRRIDNQIKKELQFTQNTIQQ